MQENPEVGPSMDREFGIALPAYRERVESAMARWIPAADEWPARVHEAMWHSLAAGGKRLRPVLLLAAVDAAGGDLDEAEAAAVAVECLHTYSLIHDDLPAMDNSPLRRGRPACHVAFDEATAILAGDALLTAAFEILADGYAGQPKLGLALVGDLAHAAGSRRLIGGQMVDIESENRPISAGELDRIHENKTGALVTASMVMGGRIAGLDGDRLASLRRAGRCLGLAYQVTDDLLDATGDAVTLGKQVGQDQRNEKNTHVRIHGIDASRRRATELSDEAIRHLVESGVEVRFLRTLVERMRKRIY